MTGVPWGLHYFYLLEPKELVARSDNDNNNIFVARSATAFEPCNQECRRPKKVHLYNNNNIIEP
jgi:hypothetical protein